MNILLTLTPEPINPTAFTLGPLTVQWYALLILTGAIIGLLMAIREAKKFGIVSDTMVDLFTFGLPITIIGARLYYVAFEWSYYVQYPEKIFAIWEGGLAIHGGIIAAVIFGFVYCRIKQINFLLLFDIVAPSFLIGQAIGRWGNFMNQEAHGGIVPGETLAQQRQYLLDFKIPEFIVNGMYIEGAYYHPTFLYESIWNLLGVGLLVFSVRRWQKILTGEVASFYLIWYSVGRYFIEGLRTDSLYIVPGLRTAQVISIIIIIVATLFIVIRRKRQWQMETYQGLKVKETK
ncbi:MAG: prolipoprotein diacylglyceryl transferase [Culicoidibacterales bacterium]